MLELDPITILLEILNFLLLSVGLYYFLFRPIVKRVKMRADKKARLEEEIRQNLLEARQYKLEQETRLMQANDAVSQLMDEARDQIERERSQMQESIRIETEQALKEAKTDIQQFQKKELEEFNEILLDTLIVLCGELIEKVTPPAVHDALVQEANDFVWKMGREQANEVESLRLSLGDRTPTIRFTSTHTLNLDQQRLLARSFSALTDRSVNFEFETNPALYGGVQVRVGDILIDNSIASQLKNIRSEVKKELHARIANA
jgi:F0F1-type ATP synthase membrane subunit b/b'